MAETAQARVDVARAIRDALIAGLIAFGVLLPLIGLSLTGLAVAHSPRPRGAGKAPFLTSFLRLDGRAANGAAARVRRLPIAATRPRGGRFNLDP